MAVGKYSETDSFLSRWGSALGLPEMGISELFKGDTRAAKLAASNAYTRSKAPGSGYVLGALVPNSDPLGQGQALYNAGKAQASGNTGDVSAAGPYGPFDNRIDTGIGIMPNTGGGKSSADLAAEAKAVADAKNRYIQRFQKNQQFRDYSKAFADEQYGTAVQRAGEQKDTLGSQYGRQRDIMQTDIDRTQSALSGAYSSRGLGDSSFSQKAKANADIEFNNNLQYLNENEAAQYKEIDNYLSDLAKQREFKMQEISLQDFNTQAEYEDAIAALDADYNSILSQQDALRNSVTTAVGKITGSTSIDNTMKFQEALNSILGTAMPATQRKSVLAGFLASTGNKTPEAAADYWMDWYDTQEAISSGQADPAVANEEAKVKYGQEPF